MLVHAVDAKAEHRDFQEGWVRHGDAAAAIIGANIELDLVQSALHACTIGHRMLKVAVLGTTSGCDFARVAVDPPKAHIETCRRNASGNVYGVNGYSAGPEFFVCVHHRPDPVQIHSL